MKTIIICGLFLIVSLMTSTITAKERKIREDKVPQLVQAGFKGKFHDAIIKEWMKNNSTYSVIYKKDRNKYEATFNSDGKWINTSTIINWDEIPEAVKIGFSESTYKDWTIFGLIETDSSNGTKNYGLVVDNANQYLGEEQDSGFTEIYKIYFSSQGKLISNKIQYDYNLF